MLLKAYAKINLTLDIVSKREDGYHLIDSVFQSVGVFDTVKVEKADKISVVCDMVSGEDNIAFKVAREFFTYTGIRGGAEIIIKKNIPICSGLGGGSSDAAAVIIALNEIYKAGILQSELAKTGVACGADVPFFIYGGTARVGGIGENVEPVKAARGCAIIIKQGEKQSTSDMYKRLDNMPSSENKTSQFLKILNEKGSAAALSNCDNAFSVLCADKALCEALYAQNPLCVSVSGSGPAHFAVFSTKAQAKRAVEALKKQGFEPILAPFVKCGAQIIE